MARCSTESVPFLAVCTNFGRNWVRQGTSNIYFNKNNSLNLNFAGTTSA
jgi:hypothetical protein